ncbi:MAG: hypothetical protein HRT71_17190 [Flavobacteriales bacterium]|nr:hypothetical protein [Flavobacteriales bacterium]
MNFKFDIQDFLIGTTALGVEVNLQGANADFKVTTLEKKEGSIDVVGFENYNSQETFFEKLNVEMPIYLSIGGKGIINKKVAAKETISDDDLIQLVLPNAKIADFYLQKKSLGNNQWVVSIIRKSVLDEILQEFKSLKAYVLKIVLGPFSIVNVSGLLANDNATINVPGHQLQYKKGELIAHKASTEATNGLIQIVDDQVDLNHLVSFSNALYHFSQPDDDGGISMAENQDEFKQKKIFKVAGFGLLGIFMVSLIVNFLLFENYKATYQALHTQVERDKGKLVMLASLETQLEQKKGFLDVSGILEASKTSYYSDQLANSVPKSMKLTEMHIHPIIGKIKRAEVIHFNSKSIRVEGESKKSTDFNNWVKELEKLDWIKDLKILNYSQTGGGSTGEFELEILLN